MEEQKTFIDLWMSLDRVRQSDLRAEIIAQTHVSDVTFGKWTNGNALPGSFPMEQLV
jgi:hypothetical protein